MEEHDNRRRRGKNITKAYLEQYNSIISISATITDKIWKVLVDTFQGKIEVSVDAETGRVLSFTFLKK